MNLKEKLKEITLLRLAVKRLKIYREFLCDAQSFSKHYLESAEINGEHSYRIMLLVHRLEKGMCMSNPRPFGQQKAMDLISLLSVCKNKQGYEYQLGCSVLRRWAAFIDEHQWDQDASYQAAQAFLKDCGKSALLQVGNELFSAPDITENSSFSEVIFSRHSVRDYQAEELDEEDVSYALKCFLAAPTACNRQMCKIYRIEGKEEKELLDRTIIGISGFNTDTVHYFVVTFDFASFEYSGERNQGYLNAGLTAMNFINGLHARGIGSCCLQWSNPAHEDAMVRKALHISSSERIALVIGAGYYLETSAVPCSARKGVADVFQVIGEK